MENMFITNAVFVFILSFFSSSPLWVVTLMAGLLTLRHGETWTQSCTFLHDSVLSLSASNYVFCKIAITFFYSPFFKESRLRRSQGTRTIGTTQIHQICRSCSPLRLKKTLLQVSICLLTLYLSLHFFCAFVIVSLISQWQFYMDSLLHLERALTLQPSALCAVIRAWEKKSVTRC